MHHSHMKALGLGILALGAGYLAYTKGLFGRAQAAITTAQTNAAGLTAAQMSQYTDALWNWYTKTTAHGSAGIPWPTSSIPDPNLTSLSSLSTPATLSLVTNGFQVSYNNVSGFTGYQDGVVDMATFNAVISQP